MLKQTEDYLSTITFAWKIIQCVALKKVKLDYSGVCIRGASVWN